MIIKIINLIYMAPFENSVYQMIYSVKATNRNHENVNHKTLRTISPSVKQYIE